MCGAVHAIAPTMKGLTSGVSADDAWEIDRTILAQDLQKLIDKYGEKVLHLTKLKPIVLWALYAKGFIRLPPRLLEMIQREADGILETTRLLWSAKDGDLSEQTEGLHTPILNDNLHSAPQHQRESLDVKPYQDRKLPDARHRIKWYLIGRAILYAWGIALLASLFDVLLLALGLELPGILPGLIGWIFSGYYSYTNATAGKWLHALIAMAGFYASLMISPILAWLALVLF